MSTLRNLVHHHTSLRPALFLRPQIQQQQPRRHVTDDKSGALPIAPAGEKGPNMQQAEHVSEEAAKMARMTGGEGPDLDQGTPVQDILKEEKEAHKHAPQVIKDSIKADSKPPAGSRSFSTSARHHEQDQYPSIPPSTLDPSMLPTSSQISSYQQLLPGHKFPLPTSPPSPIKSRQDPTTLQLTHLLMQSGKKATAQRATATILTHLRSSPAPTYSPTHPLLPGAPPASHLPLHPTLYLQLAIDSLAPLLRIKAVRGAAGGGQSLQVPTPLGLRQRRRQAMMWIIDAAAKRKTAGSGKDMFALKVAAEIVSVVEGKSGLWDKRAAVHKMATTARANLMQKGRRR